MPSEMEMKSVLAASQGSSGGSWIEHWNPEDTAFWDRDGKKIAYRNLVFSIFAEFLAFSVWQMWSAIATHLSDAGYAFTVNQLFWLAALPGLSGATLRVPYSFAVAKFGGRNWTLVSTLLLLIPALGLGFALQNPATPYSTFLILAFFSGLGGGNFASSMANIHYFFPQKLKGTALGLNAGGGNVGVSVVQFMVPMVIGVAMLGQWAGGPQTLMVKGVVKGVASQVAKQVWLQNGAFIWVPLIVLSLTCTALFMNNLRVSSAPLKEQLPVLKRGHTWAMSWIYIGTFGSFIGYSAGFPLLIKAEFPGVNPLSYAFLGPLVGSLIRPLGGWMADLWGGARVTFWNFLVMLLAVLGVVFFLGQRQEPYAFEGFFGMFLLLFTCTGVGNGSVYRMIPVIFRKEKLASLGEPEPESKAYLGALVSSNKEAAAVLGFVSAIGAYGAFLVPKSYGTSIALTGGPSAALLVFAAFYVSCLALTWRKYLGPQAIIHC
ncbi:MAG TPA: NarK family nitrate/nitrite MFS transporter [bacterium]|jgi:NNP family nitrate/nitrite transporter-like MFS transporter|nr:NarK family nitrate/nitrite MFS transporter [bacterium]